MSSKTKRFTHKGWFGICPIYLYDIHTHEPTIEPRSVLFEPLLWITEGVFTVVIWVRLMIDPYAEVGWPMTITGELDG